MDPATHRLHTHVLQYLSSLGVSLVDLLLSVLVFNVSPVDHDLFARHTELLSAMYFHTEISESMQIWCHDMLLRTYSESMQQLTRKEAGWHFSALRAQPQQIQDFRLDEMADTMRRVVPRLWGLIYTLMSGGQREQMGSVEIDDDEVLDDDETALWAVIDGWDKQSSDASSSSSTKQAQATESFVAVQAARKPMRKRQALRRTITVMVSGCLPMHLALTYIMIVIAHRSCSQYMHAESGSTVQRPTVRNGCFSAFHQGSRETDQSSVTYGTFDCAANNRYCCSVTCSTRTLQYTRPWLLWILKAHAKISGT